MSHHSPPLRRLGRVLVLASAVLAATGLLVIPAAAAPSANTASKIDKSLTAELNTDGSADFYVEFADRADLSAASSIVDWNGARRSSPPSSARRTPARATFASSWT